MDRSQIREFYCFIHNGQNEYFSSSYNAKGEVVISKNPYNLSKPLEMNPSNLASVQLSFGTNKTYFSGIRALMIDWNMIGDGANIVRYIKYMGKGYQDELYLTIVRQRNDGYFYKYYEGRFDLAKCKDTVYGYSCPCIDSSVWGILSQNDSVDYSIECNPQSPTAIPILFDGITLKATYTYQPVAFDITLDTSPPIKSKAINLPLINTDGDSSGVITKNQEEGYPVEGLDNYFYKTAKTSNINLSGTFRFRFKKAHNETVRIQLNVVSNLGKAYLPLGDISFTSTTDYGQYYEIAFNRNFTLDPGESLTLTLLPRFIDTVENWHVLPDVTNITVRTYTRLGSTIVYGRRPLDVLKELVAKGTNNQFTANSNFFAVNNKIVLVSGDSLRQAPNAKIKTSFQDWFRSYDIEYWLAFRILDNQLWVEPVPVVYDDTTNLFNIGEVKDIEIEDASEYLINEIVLNMNKQDYRHTNGRLEFNGMNTFSVYQYNVKNKLDLISPYRKDCFGMEFIRLDYQQQSTKDNIGDDSVFMVDITDDMAASGQEVSNFVNIEVNNTPLAPIIYYPYNNDIINNNKPVIRGVSLPDGIINVYVDGILDGSVFANSDGTFAYNINTALDAYVDGVSTGVHTIDLTYTDLIGTLSTRTVTIFDGITEPAFENIGNGQTLYDNKPVVTGFLQTGTTLPLLLDGVEVAIIEGDGNCRWSFDFGGVISNGAHTLSLGGASVTFNVNSFVEIPLITSFLTFNEIQNNMPVVEGVAKPGTKVELWLDYYEPVSLGTAFADGNGNWSIPIVELFKEDGVTPLTPIPNGNHIISTGLGIETTIIEIKGFLLNRPAYTDISGVLDNTVFNTRLTPKHNLINRMVFWKSIFAQNPNEVIRFETGDKNVDFSTTLNGVTVRENNDLKLSDYQDEPLFLPYIFNCVCETPINFADAIDNFNAGGLVECTFQGLKILCLPIGEMKVQDVTRDVQKWSMLISAKTPLITLLQLSTPGSIFKNMANSIFRSDYNTLHFVKYGFVAPIKFDEQPELYEDWFQNRNKSWLNNPTYIQKVQRTDPFVDQIVVDTVNGDIKLQLYNCKTGTLVTDYSYLPITPAPIPTPSIALQCTVDLSAIPDGQYFFVITVGGNPIAISERIALADRWEGTLLIDAGSATNKAGAIFSNGWRGVVRVEGLAEKYVANIETIINEDEVGNYDNLHALTTRKRTILFGEANGIPDYLYLKIVALSVLDDLAINGVYYTIDKNASFEPVEKVPGYPMYYYSADFELRDNQNGFAFDGGGSGFVNSVILSIDNGAFGMGGGGFTQIELN